MSNKDTQSYQSKKTNWINWFIPLLLIIVALAFLFYYPTSNVKKDTERTTTNKVQDGVFSAKSIANSLVSTYFNGTDENKNEQIRALENTLTSLNEQYLLDPNTQSTASKTLQLLKDSNLNQSIQTLIASADQQTSPRNAARTWINVGNIQNLTSAPQALLAYQKACELDPNNSNAWNRRGHLHRQLKQLEEAERAYKKAQQLTQKNTEESTESKAISLINFGLLNQSKGDYQAAEDAFLESLRIYTNLKNESGIASTSENLASLYKNKGDLKTAEAYYLKALQVHQKLAHTQQMATTHAALGNLYQSNKDLEKARQHFQYALDISLNNNLQGDIANLYSNLGIIAQQDNQVDKSKEFFEKSLQINQKIKRTASTADQFGNLAILNRKQKKYAVAEDFHKKAIHIHTQNKHKNGVVSQQINLGFLYKIWNKTDKACAVWKNSLALLQDDQGKRSERVSQLIKSNCPN